MFLDSSLLTLAIYNKKYGTLTLHFNNGSKYKYFEVPKDVALKFKKVQSAGGYYNQNIKGQYESIKLGEE